MRTDDLFRFVRERHAIWERRLVGQPKPWTQDPILQSYRFCNVYRELDTVTIWIKDNWRTPHYEEPYVWFAMVVARLVNWPDTLEVLGYPVPWDAERFVKTLEARKQLDLKVFTGAYVIPAKATYKSKAEYLAREVFTPMWTARDVLAPKPTDSLASFHARMVNCPGMGNFLAGQVVCDTKYTRVMEAASDWWTWACSGPGSKRGLNRVMERPVNASWKENEWFATLQNLRARIGPMLNDAGMQPIHAQDLQNCLCEFDKYERVRLGEGKPRSKYAGAGQ